MRENMYSLADQCVEWIQIVTQHKHFGRRHSSFFRVEVRQLWKRSWIWARAYNGQENGPFKGHTKYLLMKMEATNNIPSLSPIHSSDTHRYLSTRLHGNILLILFHVSLQSSKISYFTNTMNLR
jgi:hypothetical protein